MINKKLSLCWATLDFLYFGAAILCFVFVFAWRGLGDADIANEEMYLRRLVVTAKDAWAALFIGVFILLSVLYSLPAYFVTRRPSQSTAYLTAHNVMLVLAALATTAVGTAVWFYTLRQRDNFEVVWREAGPKGQQVLQDWMGCCGYWNASSAGLFASPTGLCASPQVAANVSLIQGCVTPMTKFSDNTLNNVFSTIYGIVVIQAALFLGTACLRVNKREEERFRRIDEKRGAKGGFV